MADEQQELSSVPIQPLDVLWGIGIAQIHDTKQKLVMLRMSTPQGVSHYFLDGGMASKLAGALGQNAREILAWEHAHNPKLIVPNGEA